MKFETMKVRVTSIDDNLDLWYKLGEEYEVLNTLLKYEYGGVNHSYYPLVNDKNIGIGPEHCKVIQEQPKFPFKVRCIDNENVEYALVAGEIYTATGECYGEDYTLMGVNCTWSKNRFEIVNDNILGPQEYIPDPVEEKLVIDAHYSFNYTLTEKDRDAGAIKVDPYFVSRLWNIGAKDTSGVIWHIFKTCARFGDKNDKEREIVAIYKSIKRLAELEGVKLD
jgi:hypothetical protein